MSYLGILALWAVGGAFLELLYVMVIETVMGKHCLECADRYQIMRFYRRIWVALDRPSLVGADQDLASMLVGPLPPLLGLLEILFRRLQRPAPSDSTPAI